MDNLTYLEWSSERIRRLQEKVTELEAEIAIRDQLLAEVVANPGLAPGRNWRDRFDSLASGLC